MTDRKRVRLTDSPGYAVLAETEIGESFCASSRIEDRARLRSASPDSANRQDRQLPPRDPR